MTGQALPNPYEVLGLEIEASPADIKRAYIKKVREHPPELDPEGFKQIRRAYDYLQQPEARLKFELANFCRPEFITLPEQHIWEKPLTIDWRLFAAADPRTDLDRVDFTSDVEGDR